MIINRTEHCDGRFVPSKPSTPPVTEKVYRMKRRLDTIRCAACSQLVDVGYPYAVEFHTVGLADHEQVGAMTRRCPHAGLTLIDHGRVSPYAANLYDLKPYVALAR